MEVLRQTGYINVGMDYVDRSKLSHIGRPVYEVSRAKLAFITNLTLKNNHHAPISRVQNSAILPHFANQNVSAHAQCAIYIFHGKGLLTD